MESPSAQHSATFDQGVLRQVTSSIYLVRSLALNTDVHNAGSTLTRSCSDTSNLSGAEFRPPHRFRRICYRLFRCQHQIQFTAANTSTTVDADRSKPPFAHMRKDRQDQAIQAMASGHEAGSRRMPIHISSPGTLTDPCASWRDQKRGEEPKELWR